MTQTCDDAYARLDDLRQLALAHAKGCTQDSDCTLVDSSIPCQDDCLAAVLVSEKVSFEGALSTYAAEECPAVQNGNGSTCRVSPSCAALSGADCINGTCYPVVAGAGAPPPSEPPADAGSDVPGTPDAG